MKNIVLLLFLVFIFSCKNSNEITPAISTKTIFSQTIKDSFLITINKPVTYDSLKKYTLVVVADGAIKLGKKTLSYCTENPDSCKNKLIIMTVSHQGDWAEKRRRDFIPSDISHNATQNFGHAYDFYLLLKKEILPSAYELIPNIDKTVFIGHSFSGLLSLYLPLKDSTLFDKYYAISPSCWANYNELLKIENQYASTNTSLPSDIKIFAGGLETFNKVLSSTNEYHQQLLLRNYQNLKLDYEILPHQTHISILDPALHKIISDITKKK